MQIDHTQNIIEVEDVSFTYDKEEVLKNITFNVYRGDYLGIVGPNGGGKTTLLKIILGLLKPDKGSVKIFGQEIEYFHDWYKIGYIPQKAVNFDLNFPITVEEVVAMGRYGKKGLFKMMDRKDKRLIAESLKQVEMWNYKDKIMGDLSGGQQQRVFIARALSSEPEIIFLDEPTIGVDQEIQKKFFTFLRKLNKDLGLTLILVSHDSNIIVQETTEIACVNKTIIYESDPKEILKMVFHKH